MDRLRILALGILALTAIYVSLSFLVLPGIAHEKIISAFAKTGFDVSFMDKPQAGFGFIVYKDVKFDKDGFTEAKAIRASYDMAGLLLKGEFSDLTIVGLTIAGDWDDANFASLSFAGWKPLSDLPLSIFRHISVESSNLSLLTQNAGGVIFNFNIDAIPRSGKTQIEAHVKSDQPLLTLSAGLSGELENGQWSLKADIEDGKFSTPDNAIKVTRMNGSTNFSSPLKVSGQLRAGGLTLYGLPWNNATITIDGDGVKTIAQSLNPSGVNLELDIAQQKIKGFIHADKISTLIDYLNDKKTFIPIKNDLEKVKGAAEATINLSSNDLKTLKYQIKDAKKSGQIKLNP